MDPSSVISKTDDRDTNIDDTNHVDDDNECMAEERGRPMKYYTSSLLFECICI